MARYIDADKLLNERTVFIQDEEGFDIAVVAVADIELAPTADVEEVKHGEWLPVEYVYFGPKRYECSECKGDDYWRKRYNERKENFCPNCGAKMDGDTK